jgi:Tfp pilus assembly protein PilO
MRDFNIKKRAIVAMLSVLVTADLALAVYSYELASAPYTSQKQFDEQTIKLGVLKKDIKDAQTIKDNMPGTLHDCDKFERDLPLESIGSSTVTADLDELARKSGLQMLTFTSEQKEVQGRPFIEHHISMTVNGDYASVARFINGLQRSNKFYILDDLTVSSEAQSKGPNGALSVALHLRTYFREAA